MDNSDGEEYGLSRFVGAVRLRLRVPKEHLLDGLIKEAQEFGQRIEFEDDVCLVAMEVDRTGTSQ